MSIWTDAEEVPVAGVASPSALERRAKWMRRLVKLSVVLLPVTLFALLATVTRMQASSEVAGGAASASQGQAAADVALRAWLAGDPAPIPGGYVVSWEGATRPPAGDDGLGSGDRVVYPTEIDSFMVADAVGQLYRASVLVALDPAGGSTVIGSPSLTYVPSTRDSGVDADSAWGTMQPATVSDEVQSAVRVWAEAFTSDDGAKLRLAVGDQDSSHAYLPMPVLAGAVPDATRGALVPTGDPKKAPTQMVARVDLDLARGDAPDDPGAGTTVSYDVLVDHYDTGAPVVVAWGPPGSGPTLVPYQNAYPGDIPTVTVQSAAPDTATAPQADVTPRADVPLGADVTDDGGGRRPGAEDPGAVAAPASDETATGPEPTDEETEQP